jgi:hypothetical protein
MLLQEQEQWNIVFYVCFVSRRYNQDEWVERFTWDISVQKSQLRVAVAETWGQFGKPEKGECPLLEAVTRRLMKDCDWGH